ncbi:Organic cation/carnitine transporter 7 [Orobanche gracilis]
MAAMFFLCFIILLPLMFHQPQSLTTGLLFGARICITGTFTVIYIYAPEISDIHEDDWGWGGKLCGENWWNGVSSCCR